MKSLGRLALLCFVLLVSVGQLQAGVLPTAGTLSQYASKVIDYSSQYSSDSWSAKQVLGAPDTFAYGDIRTAWAPRRQNGRTEFVAVGFDTEVYAHQVTVRETWGNGFVRKLDVIDQGGSLHTVWSGVDPSQAGSPVDFKINFKRTDFLVKGVKVYIDTNNNRRTWEEIDSIQLVGATVPEPASLAVFGIGTLALACGRRRQRRASAA